MLTFDRGQSKVRGPITFCTAGTLGWLVGLSLLEACINVGPAHNCDATRADADVTCQSASASAAADSQLGCDREFDYITAPEANLTGPIVQIAMDTEQLYFITLDHLYSVSRNGGTPLKLFTRNLHSGATLAALFMREDDLVIHQDAANNFIVPKAGGTATRLPSLEHMRDATLGVQDEHVVIGWNNAERERAFWKLDLASMQFSELGRVPQPAGDDRAALAGDTLLWTDNPRPYSVNTLLYAMPTHGGAAEEVHLLPEFDRRFLVFGATRSELYLFGTNDSPEFQLLRVTLDGREVQALASVSEHSEQTSATRFAATDAGVLLSLHEKQAGGAVDRYWLPSGTRSPQRLGCIAAIEGPAFVLEGSDLYSAITGARGNAGIVHRALP